MEKLPKSHQTPRPFWGLIDVALVAAIVAAVVLAVVRNRSPLDRAPEVAQHAPISEQGQTVTLQLEMPDLQPALARQIQPGDVLTIGGRQLAEIDEIETYPIDVLAYHGQSDAAFSTQPSGRLRVVARAVVPQWLDELAQFRLGSVADFQTARYSIPVRIIGIDETPPRPPVPANPGMSCVISADNVPQFIAEASIPGAYGADPLGYLRVRIDEVIANNAAPSLRMYAFNDYSAYSERFVAGGLLLRPPESRDLLLRLTVWPDQTSRGAMLDGTVLLPGIRADFTFRRFTVHAQVVSLGPDAP